jgi:hypothetical protein
LSKFEKYIPRGILSPSEMFIASCLPLFYHSAMV